MREKKKSKSWGRSLARNKRYYGFFSLITAGLLIISSSFAWGSWHEWKQNHLQGNPKLLTPQVEIQGSIGPQILTHQELINRNLTVKNTGDIPVFIRVNLVEELVMFEIDTIDKTGNGHLKEYSKLPPGGVELKSDILETWHVGNFFKKATDSTYLKSTKRESYAYLQNEAVRPINLKSIQLNLGNIDSPKNSLTGYWLYDETNGVGYYYYSDIVDVGGVTTELIKTMELTSQAPNGLKGGLHQLEIKAVGGEALAGIYAEWGISEVAGNKVYDRYNELLNR